MNKLQTTVPLSKLQAFVEPAGGGAALDALVREGFELRLRSRSRKGGG